MPKFPNNAVPFIAEKMRSQSSDFMNQSSISSYDEYKAPNIYQKPKIKRARKPTFGLDVVRKGMGITSFPVTVGNKKFPLSSISKMNKGQYDGSAEFAIVKGEEFESMENVDLNGQLKNEAVLGRTRTDDIIVSPVNLNVGE